MIIYKHPHLQGNDMQRRLFLQSAASFTCLAVSSTPSHAFEERKWIRKYMVQAGLEKDLLRFASLRGAALMMDVQKYVNGLITYEDDDVLYQTPEYWATPIETLKNRKGDCEDFCILKWAIFAAIGLHNVRFVGSKCLNPGEAPGLLADIAYILKKAAGKMFNFQVPPRHSGHLTLEVHFDRHFYTLDNGGPVTDSLSSICEEDGNFSADTLSPFSGGEFYRVYKLDRTIERMKSEMKA